MQFGLSLNSQRMLKNKKTNICYFIFLGLFASSAMFTHTAVAQQNQALTNQALTNQALTNQAQQDQSQAIPEQVLQAQQNILNLGANNALINPQASGMSDADYNAYMENLRAMQPGLSAQPELQLPQPPAGAPATTPQIGPIYSSTPSQGLTSSPPGLPPLPTEDMPSSLATSTQRQQDFDTALENQLGLKPDQIRKIRQLLDQQERAASEPPGPPPKPVTGSLNVSLEPGAAPPILRTAAGSVTSFVVVDSTGQPWPVENFRVSNQSSFVANRLDGPGGSSFTIDSMQRYAQANIVLKLAGSPAPLVLGLASGLEEMDARVEIRVQGRGPNAQVVHSTLQSATDSALLPVLDGVAPTGSKQLVIDKSSGINGWMTPLGTMLIRTPHKIVSPASKSFVSSAGGFHVYEFAPVSSILVLQDGLVSTVSIRGW
jgi:intracellular multiplication protein IcmK